jgi:hypothetical protein
MFTERPSRKRRGGATKVAAASISDGILKLHLDLTAGSLASMRRIPLWLIGR